MNKPFQALAGEVDPRRRVASKAFHDVLCCCGAQLTSHTHDEAELRCADADRRLLVGLGQRLGVFQETETEDEAALKLSDAIHDLIVGDAEKGELFDLLRRLGVPTYEPLSCCSDCGWSGRDFHACPGRPGEHTF